ncbi:MAG: peptidoglycan recognition protein family protein [Planctomycetota bacterium]|jgi:hypothetical protein
MDALELAEWLDEQAQALDTVRARLADRAAELRQDGALDRPAPVVAPVSLLDVLKTNTSARYPFPNWKRSLSQVRWMTIHHSAGSRETQNIEWWHRYHTTTKSWSRAGYHFGIAALKQGGQIELYQLNRLQTHSWHDSRNWDTFGVCLAGDLRAGRDVRPNDVQLKAFGRLIAWLREEWELPNWTAIVGHKSFGSTACPGDFHLWRDDLIDAAWAHGHDISGMMTVRTEALAARTFAVSSAARRVATFWRRRPGAADYDEHAGLDG